MIYKIIFYLFLGINNLKISTNCSQEFTKNNNIVDEIGQYKKSSKNEGHKKNRIIKHIWSYLKSKYKQKCIYDQYKDVFEREIIKGEYISDVTKLAKENPEYFTTKRLNFLFFLSVSKIYQKLKNEFTLDNSNLKLFILNQIKYTKLKISVEKEEEDFFQFKGQSNNEDFYILRNDLFNIFNCIGNKNYGDARCGWNEIYYLFEEIYKLKIYEIYKEKKSILKSDKENDNLIKESKRIYSFDEDQSEDCFSIEIIDNILNSLYKEIEKVKKLNDAAKIEIQKDKDFNEKESKFKVLNNIYIERKAYCKENNKEDDEGIDYGSQHKDIMWLDDIREYKYLLYKLNYELDNEQDETLEIRRKNFENYLYRKKIYSSSVKAIFGIIAIFGIKNIFNNRTLNNNNKDIPYIDPVKVDSIVNIPPIIKKDEIVTNINKFDEINNNSLLNSIFKFGSVAALIYAGKRIYDEYKKDKLKNLKNKLNKIKNNILKK